MILCRLGMKNGGTNLTAKRLEEAIRLSRQASPDLCYVLTSAPTIYDGFGTETAVEVGADRAGVTWRMVAMRREHAQWQRDRYFSGLYAALPPDNLKEMDSLRERFLPPE